MRETRAGYPQAAAHNEIKRSALGWEGVRTIVITDKTILRRPDRHLGKRPSRA